MTGFTIVLHNEASTVGATTAEYKPSSEDTPIEHYYNFSESKFETLARTNGTDRQIEFLRSLKKVSRDTYQKVEDYLDTIRLNLSEEEIKRLLLV